MNRDHARGEELARLLNERTPAAAQLVIWDSTYTVPPDTDIVVNATSIGLFPDVEGRLNVELGSLLPGMVVADVIPNPPQTDLLRNARERGCTTLDGLGMLSNQGVISVHHWTGVHADPAVMRRALEELFQTPTF